MKSKSGLFFIMMVIIGLGVSISSAYQPVMGQIEMTPVPTLEFTSTPTGTATPTRTPTVTQPVNDKTPTPTFLFIPPETPTPTPPGPAPTPVPTISILYNKGRFYFTANQAVNRTFPLKWYVGGGMETVPGQLVYNGTQTFLPVLGGSHLFCLEAEGFKVVSENISRGGGDNCWQVPPTVISLEQRGKNMKLYSDFQISKSWMFRWEWDDGRSPMTQVEGFNSSVTLTMSIPEGAKRICFDPDYGYQVASNLPWLPYGCWPTDQHDPVLDVSRGGDEIVFDVPIVITTTYPVTFTLEGGEVLVASWMADTGLAGATFVNSRLASVDLPYRAVSFTIQLFGDYDIPPGMLLPDGRMAIPPKLIRIYLPFIRNEES